MLLESIWTISTLSKVANTATLLGVLHGLWNRRRPRRHIPVMLGCFAVDLANVLVVEFSARSRGKGAIEKGMEAFGSEDYLLVLHIVVSVLMLAGYVVAVFTGVRLYGKGKGRRVHLANAVVFLVMRLANYVTAFLVT